LPVPAATVQLRGADGKPAVRWREGGGCLPSLRTASQPPPTRSLPDGQSTLALTKALSATGTGVLAVAICVVAAGGTVPPALVAGGGGGDDPAGVFAQPVKAASSTSAAEAASRSGRSDDGEEKREKMSGC
jgi:hypothetical protein